MNINMNNKIDEILKKGFIDYNLYDIVLKKFKVDFFECYLEEGCLANWIQNWIILSFPNSYISDIKIPYKKDDIEITIRNNYDYDCKFSKEFVKSLLIIFKNIPLNML